MQYAATTKNRRVIRNTSNIPVNVFFKCQSMGELHLAETSHNLRQT